jgi:cyclopropane fatty-acyl-phospholipid synthase-like methyltransferase
MEAKMSDALSTIADRINEETNFTGGPIELFETVGRDTFVTLLQNGLLPEHRLLDFGCGALRLAYWFIRFLDAGNYYGIEPVRKMVEAGKKHAIGEELLAQKRPRFAFVDTCDMGTFNQTFDFVVARSLLTHMTPGMVHETLASFNEWSTPNAAFLASYCPSEGPYAVDQKGEIGDYLADDDWRFIGVAKYSLPYMERAAERAGLRVQEFLRSKPINGQTWLKFAHA